MDRECFRYFQLWFVEFDTITKQVFPSIASYISETAHIFFVNTTVIQPLPTGFFKLTPTIPIIASSFMWNLIASAFDRQQRAISWPFFFPGQSRIFFVRAGFKLSGTESSSLEYPDYLFDVKNSYSQQYFHSGGFRYYFCISGFLQMDVNLPYCSLINFLHLPHQCSAIRFCAFETAAIIIARLCTWPLALTISHTKCTVFY